MADLVSRPARPPRSPRASAGRAGRRPRASCWPAGRPRRPRRARGRPRRSPRLSSGRRGCGRRPRARAPARSSAPSDDLETEARLVVEPSGGGSAPSGGYRRRARDVDAVARDDSAREKPTIGSNGEWPGMVRRSIARSIALPWRRFARSTAGRSSSPTAGVAAADGPLATHGDAARVGSPRVRLEARDGACVARRRRGGVGRTR